MNEPRLSPDAERARAKVQLAEAAFQQAVANGKAPRYMTAGQAGALERTLREAHLQLQTPWQSLHMMGYGDSPMCARIKAVRTELEALANGLGVAVVLDCQDLAEPGSTSSQPSCPSTR